MSFDVDKIAAQIKMFRESCKQLTERIDQFEDFIVLQVEQEAIKREQSVTEVTGISKKLAETEAKLEKAEQMIADRVATQTEADTKEDAEESE